MINIWRQYHATVNLIDTIQTVSVCACKGFITLINLILVAIYARSASLVQFSEVYFPQPLGLIAFPSDVVPWWRHQMETFSALLAFVRGIHQSPVNSPHNGQWRGALIFSLIRALNERLSKQSWGWWFETPSRSLWRHFNANGQSLWHLHLSHCTEWTYTFCSPSH